MGRLRLREIFVIIKLKRFYLEASSLFFEVCHTEGVRI